jgi:hypothetical protein
MPDGQTAHPRWRTGANIAKLPELPGKAAVLETTQGPHSFAGESGPATSAVPHFGLTL